jgi:peroxiredoxin
MSAVMRVLMTPSRTLKTIKENSMITLINSKVPDFKVQAYHQDKFVTVTQNDLKGKWSIFFFYPADFTFVCPTELGDMADKYAKFKELGVEVYSVSTDTHFTHKAWHDTSDTIKKIQFPMLADPTGHLARSFGVYIEEEGLAYRGTFLVNPEGQIKLAEVNDNGIGRNADELYRKVQAAQYVATHDGEVCPAKWTPGEKTLKPGLNLVGKI